MEAHPRTWQEFTPLSRSIGDTARGPTRRALADERKSLTWAELDALVDRIAASLQRDGVRPRGAIAIARPPRSNTSRSSSAPCARGSSVAPLAPSSTSASLAAMIADYGAALVFMDASTRETFETIALDRPQMTLDDSAGESLARWLAPDGMKPRPVEVAPDWTFNIIYSSGTTGAPKGIDQPHGMRWLHVRRSALFGYDADAVTLVSTPLYSNTTLVSVFPRSRAAAPSC